MNKNLSKIFSFTAILLTAVTFTSTTHAQIATDDGTSSFVMSGANGQIAVSTFDIDFGTGTPSQTLQNKIGTIVGNDGYIKITDMQAINAWYATIDLTDLSAGAGKLITDVNAKMTNSAARVILQGNDPDGEIVTVPQMNVNFAGAGGWTFAGRESVASSAVGIYGFVPSFNLDIPAFTRPGNYQGQVLATIFQM